MTQIFQRLTANAPGLLILLDPGRTDPPEAARVARVAQDAGVAALLIGSSFDGAEHTGVVAEAVKHASSLPLLLFPGCAAQLTPLVDAVLLLSLVSGRNAQYLIDEHVRAVPFFTRHAMEAISKVARAEYGLSGAVQHGASTVAPENFHQFPEHGASEVHLATEFQNMTYEGFPAGLREEMYAWVHANAADERKPKDTDEQFLYRSRKKAIGPFKRELWSLPAAIRQQISAGLGFSISGMPYWTMDIGGYTMASRFSARNPTPENAEEWRELNARWFQFGTFCPLTRLHGELQPREPWTFGDDNHPAYQTIVKFDRLRYRLLPYLYSLAGSATHNTGTMLRPFVMDFPGDTAARGITDEYLFGPAYLVAPVTTYRARNRSVYLPQARGGWFDFWSGAQLDGGQRLDAPAPYDSMPLFVRAGSIVPFGPELQYVDEKPADPVALFVYAGADGAFTLYEDDGVSYGYERGAFTRIPLQWNDARKTLTIGKRDGKFPGMLTSRTFELVLVSKEKPVSFSFTPKADRAVTYQGKPVKVTFE